jgi:hypothetical protein
LEISGDLPQADFWTGTFRFTVTGGTVMGKARAYAARFDPD